jgi:hypothetical protein
VEKERIFKAFVGGGAITIRPSAATYEIAGKQKSLQLLCAWGRRMGESLSTAYSSKRANFFFSFPRESTTDDILEENEK